MVLGAGGFKVTSARVRGRGHPLGRAAPPAAVLLDLRLPDGSGVEVCRTLRQWSAAPLIVVSAMDDEDQKIEALDAGADDYVTKPFSAAGAAGARARGDPALGGPPGDAPLIRFGDAVVDLERRLVRRAGDAGPPDGARVRAARLPARHPGRVLTHAALLQRVWGPSSSTETHYLRVYMANLRRKLEPDPATPPLPAHRERGRLPARERPLRTPSRASSPTRRAGSGRGCSAEIVPARKSSPTSPSARVAASALACRTPACAIRWLIASWERVSRTSRGSACGRGPPA